MRRLRLLAVLSILFFLSACHKGKEPEIIDAPEQSKYEFAGDEVLLYYTCFYQYPEEVTRDFDSFLVYADGTVVTGSNTHNDKRWSILLNKIPSKIDDYFDSVKNSQRYELYMKDEVEQLILNVQSIDLESKGEEYPNRELVSYTVNDQNSYLIQCIQWDNEKQEDWFLVYEDWRYNTYDKHAQAAREIVEQTELFKTWKAACEEKRIKNLRGDGIFYED